MDKPIFCPRYKDKNYGDSDKLGLRQRLRIALLNDNKTVFMNLIKDPGFEGVREYFTVDRIFALDALEIGSAVLNGEAKDLIRNKLKDGMNPLRLATISFAPRLTNHFLRMCSTVDDTSIALSAYVLLIRPRQTLFDLLWRLCFHFRDHMEIIRMFVQSDEQREWAREEVLKYAQYGQLPKLAALFLAAPELFSKSPERGELSLLGKLNNQLNLSELGTHIKKQLSMLLDVFDLVGHKLATYIRLEKFAPKSITKEEIEQSMLEIESFLREAVIEKHGQLDVDYYLSFFEDGERNSDDDKVGKRNSDDDDLRREQVWDKVTSGLVGNQIYYCLPIILQGTGVKRHKVLNLIPTLEGQIPDRAANLTRATGVSALHNHEQFTREEYETIPEEKRKALLSLNEKTKGEERKIDVKEFQSMQLVSKKNDDELFMKLDSEKDKRRDAAQREKKSKKSVSINEFLKLTEGETHYRPGGRRRGRGRGDRGGRYGGGVGRLMSGNFSRCRMMMKFSLHWILKRTKEKKESVEKFKKDSKKDKRKKTAERVEEAKRVRVDEFLAPAEGETHYRSGGHGRKKGRVDRGKRYVGGGGYAKN